MNGPQMYFPNGKAAHVAYLERKLTIIGTLCGALADFLSIDVQDQLEAIKKIEERPEYEGPSLDEFNRAQEKVDYLHQQMEAAQTYLDSKALPEEARGLLGAQLMPLQMMLKQAEEYRDDLQRAMEETQKEPAQ